jgi:hypothetical protein
VTPEEIAELEAKLEPVGWEPPETLSAMDVLALAARPGDRGADVLSGTNAYDDTREFCGAYKGDHAFEDGANQCRCGRAYLRAPR